MQLFSLGSKKKASPKKTNKRTDIADGHRSTPLSTTKNSTVNSDKKEDPPTLSYYDIRLDSLYKDIIVIQGTPLESAPVSLSGTVLFSLNEDVSVKRIRLRLTGNFKLEFLQMSKSKTAGGMASIVKEQQTLIECHWDNILISPTGIITTNNISSFNKTGESPGHGNEDSRANNNSMDVPNRENTSTPTKKSNLKFRIKPKPTKNPVALELPEGGFSGTPFPDIDPQMKHTFLLRKGNYELPFRIMLPSDIPETVEGLQSSSILYTMECTIDRRRKKNNIMLMNETDKKNLNAILATSGNIISSSYEAGMFNQSLNIGNKLFTKYKYIRVLRTLSADNLAMQEEMSVGNTLLEKLQYEIKIPSRAIPIGGRTPIQIKLFPFQKNYKLCKISLSLIQVYSMKDSEGQVYEDEVVVNRQSMTEFGDLTEAGTNILIDKFELYSSIQLPDDLKRVTQDCDIKNDLIHVHHKLTFQIVLKRAERNLEIKASIPVLLFISPQVPMKGRLVLFDQMTGKIHFRTGKLVPLFASVGGLTPGAVAAAAMNASLSYEGNGEAAGISASAATNQWRGDPITGPQAPPPNYQERTSDQLIQHLEQLELTAPSSAIEVPPTTNSIIPSAVAANTNISTETTTEPALADAPYAQPPPLWGNVDIIPEYTETP